MIFKKTTIIALLAVMSLSACGMSEQKTSIATYSPYPFEDETPKVATEENEYSPYAKAFFGFGGEPRHIYFDYYSRGTYIIRTLNNSIIGAIIRNEEGDYLMYNIDTKLIFTLFHTRGSKFLIMDPLGTHYGFLDFNFRTNFIARDFNNIMFNNIWFQPLYFSYPQRNYLLRDRIGSPRRPIIPTIPLRDPNNNPAPGGVSNAGEDRTIQNLRKTSEEYASTNSRAEAVDDNNEHQTIQQGVVKFFRAQKSNASGSNGIRSFRPQGRSGGGIPTIRSYSRPSSSGLGGARAPSRSNNRNSVKKTEHN